MKEIPLTQGKVAIVDDDDYKGLCQYKWHAVRIGNSWYAVRGRNPRVYMHRLLMKADAGFYIDHINSDGLMNCRSNLRQCTHRENTINQRKQSSPRRSRYKGVTRYVHTSQKRKPWVAQIKVHGKHFTLGYFEAERDAAKAYNEAASFYFGEFARLNEI